MHALEQSITINSTPSLVYQALTTEAGLQAWHTADATGVGTGLWHLGKSGKSGFEWEVRESTPDDTVSCACIDGPGSSPGTEVRYTMSANPAGGTDVYLVHSGWNSREGEYDKCDDRWAALLASLKAYIESGVPSPVF